LDFFVRGGGLQAGTFEHLYIAITPGENLKEVFSGRIHLIQQHEGNEPHSRGLENATFEQQRQLIDMQDALGRYAIENDENVVYINWILGQQLVSVAQHRAHQVRAIDTKYLSSPSGWLSMEILFLG
jgi:hypothetical protein